MPYYMLFTRADANSRWHPQFGDYLRKDVVQEMRDSYRSDKRSNCRIVRLPDDHRNTLDAVTREINGDQ